MGAPSLIPRQGLFWILMGLILIALFWLLRGIILPFVLGMALAYVGDPLADRLERLGAPRWVATIVVLGAVVGVGVLLAVLVVPIIVDQATQFFQQVPRYIDFVRHRALPDLSKLVARWFSPHEAADLQSQATAYVGTAGSWMLGLLSRVWSGGLAIADILYVLFLTPLVAFYFLRDWDRMVAKLDSWLPRRHSGTVRAIVHEIDEILAGFIRGQATVCIIFATYYSAALTLAGLEFGIIIGIGAGMLTFIPYLGAITGLVVSVIVAFIQFQDHGRILIVAGVYILGHLVEANIVTPMLVGDRVKLHPVWIIFSLMAGGALFGFTGVLLAVPVAAVIGVMVRFAIKEYLDSSLYDDHLADSLTLSTSDEP